MIFLTSATTEEQLNGFTEFLKTLTWEKLILSIISLIVCLVAIKILTKQFNKIIAKSKLDPTLHALTRTLFKGALIVIALLIITSTLGMDVTILVAVFSVVSLAISLAVQDTLANVAGGLTLLASKPFGVGDYVEIGSTGGTVLRIGLTYTDLKTPNNQDVHIPNSTVASATITNYSTNDTRRLQINVSASYDAPVATVKAALLEAAKLEHVLEDPAPQAQLSAYGDHAIEYFIRVWVPSSSYWDVNFNLLENIKVVFDREGIEMTYPHLNVHMR